MRFYDALPQAKLFMRDFKFVILNTYESGNERDRGRDRERGGGGRESSRARDCLAAFHLHKIINFLPDPFSTVSLPSEDNLYAPHFERIMRVHVRELMRNMRRGGKAKYGAYFSLRHFQREIIVFNN